MLHDGDLGWHENTTGGFNQLLDEQLHHFLSHVLCVVCCDFLILGPEFDMYSDYFLPEETTLLYANLLSILTFDLRFISFVTHQSVAPFHFPTWFQALGHIDPSFRALGSSCLHPWKLTAGTPSMQVWFRWFSRTKEVIFRSYVSFRGGVPPKCSAFKSEFNPLPYHQSPINAALTFAAPQQFWCFFFGVLIPAPAREPRLFFAQPSFEDRFLLAFPWPKGEAWALGFCWN